MILQRTVIPFLLDKKSVVSYFDITKPNTPNSLD